MKTTTLALIFFLSGLFAWAQFPPQRQSGFPAFPSPPPLSRNPANPGANRAANPAANPVFPAANPAANPAMNRGGNPSAGANGAKGGEAAGYQYDWPAVDINQVLDVYADLVGRTLLRPSNLPAGTITLKMETPLTKEETIEALQALLSLNGISVINIGDKFAEVLPSSDAGGSGAEINTNANPNDLPDLGSYVTRIIQLNYVKPSEVVPIITPLAKLNSIIPIDSNGILVIRDYAENVKRMLEMIKMIDVNMPMEYISEVIPIRYAQASDIASALNSLGGQGSSTVTFGSSSTPSSVNGVGHPGGTGGGVGGGVGEGMNRGVGMTTPYSNNNQIGSQATTTPNGTPTTGSTFQQRLMNIINRANTPATGGSAGQSAIQVFGQAKIIADERSNSLLVFATRADMVNIKAVIAKLDVLLSQVLIESVIIDYSLGPNTLTFGVSAGQNPQTYSSNPQIVSGGGMNNGPSFVNTTGELLGTNSTAATSSFLSTIASGGGLSYFGDIGPHWDLALQAAQSDSHATIVQRPSVMTSQAKPAQFFVGDTVPYITGTSYGGYYGDQSSYSQLAVGVELDVTPFINPQGLVVMDINEQLNALNGYTTITGVGNIPNTIQRTLSSEVAVQDRDTIMLGGFIENDKSIARSGIPLLMDIPLLGNLFASRSDTKQREELIVMMRPTVLKTPELAAAETAREQQELPGVAQAEAEDAVDQRKSLEAERLREIRDGDTNGAEFSPAPAANPGSLETNEPAP